MQVQMTGQARRADAKAQLKLARRPGIHRRPQRGIGQSQRLVDVHVVAEECPQNPHRTRRCLPVAGLDAGEGDRGDERAESMRSHGRHSSGDAVAPGNLDDGDR